MAMSSKAKAAAILENCYPLSNVEGHPHIQAAMCEIRASRMAASGDVEGAYNVFRACIDGLDWEPKLAADNLNRYFRKLCIDENGPVFRKAALPFGLELMKHPVLEAARNDSPLSYIKSRNNLSVALLELAETSEGEARKVKVKEVISILEDTLREARAANLEEQAHLIGNLRAAREKL